MVNCICIFELELEIISDFTQKNHERIYLLSGELAQLQLQESAHTGVSCE
jgi:hypothetical protein